MKSSGHPVGSVPPCLQPAQGLATALSGYASQGPPGAASLRPTMGVPSARNDLVRVSGNAAPREGFEAVQAAAAWAAAGDTKRRISCRPATAHR